MKRILNLAILVAVMTLIFGISASCDSSQPEETLPPAPLEPGPPPPKPGELWKPDGIINADEYLGEMQSGGYELRWTADDEYAYFGITAKTEGWVAVGFNPSTAMKDADMVFGFVQDGQVVVEDQYSTGAFGPHSPDTELGGSNDIFEFGGKEEGGITTIEFSRALTTGDEYDNDLMPGDINIIWSYGSTDNTTQQHVTRGSGEITL